MAQRQIQPGAPLQQPWKRFHLMRALKGVSFPISNSVLVTWGRGILLSKPFFAFTNIQENLVIKRPCNAPSTAFPVDHVVSGWKMNFAHEINTRDSNSEDTLTNYAKTSQYYNVSSLSEWRVQSTERT